MHAAHCTCSECSARKLQHDQHVASGMFQVAINDAPPAESPPVIIEAGEPGPGSFEIVAPPDLLILLIDRLDARVKRLEARIEHYDRLFGELGCEPPIE